MPDTDSSHPRTGGLPRAEAEDVEAVTFAEWRATRPFYAALAVVAGGLLVAWPSVAFLVAARGFGGGSLVPFGVVVGVLLVLTGVGALLRPEHADSLGLAAMALSTLSFFVTFGGYLVGMALAGLGGALCFGWTPDPEGPAPLLDASGNRADNRDGNATDDDG